MKDKIDRRHEEGTTGWGCTSRGARGGSGIEI